MFLKNIHYSPDLEAAVLGVCLLEQSAFGRTYDLIDEATFYFQANKEVYKSLRVMYDAGIPIDIFTVTDHLSRIRGIQSIQNENVPFVVARLTQHVVSGAHLEYHCQIIKTMWIQREIIRLTSSGTPAGGSIKSQIIGLQERLHQLSQKTAQSDWKDMTEMMVGLYQHQEAMKKTSGMGITTGFPKLDHQSGGFHPGQLIVIGARPSVGKSALAGQMAIEMAKKGFRVGIISLEMNNNEIAARLAALDSETDFNVVFRGLYQDEAQRDRIFKRIGSSTSTLPIFVTDKTDVNINDIRAKAMKLQHTEGLDILMIDYLQLIDSDESRISNRENEIRKISRGAKIMAKEMNIPVVELCQLNREITKRQGASRYPQLSDLRESGAIEQDADIVMFLHRDWMTGIEQDEQGYSTERQADLVIRKWRNGNANFMVQLDFDPPKMKFSQRGYSSPLPGNWMPVEVGDKLSSDK